MKIFLSSTYLDLIEYRKAATEALERLGQHVGRMELFGARAEEPLAACLREIEDCDLFVGIYAHRYGYVPPRSARSITEQEFNHARKCHKSLFCFQVDEKYNWPSQSQLSEDSGSVAKLLRFKKKMRKELVVDTFGEPLDLAVKVATSVGSFIARNPELTITPAENAGAKSQREQLVKLLDLRKERILQEMKSRHSTALASLREGGGGGGESEKEFIKRLTKIKNKFLELHTKNIEAIRKGQLLLSHELTSHIYALLYIEDLDTFNATRASHPPGPYSVAYRDWEGELNEKYPTVIGGWRMKSGSRNFYDLTNSVSQWLRATEEKPAAPDTDERYLKGWWEPIAAEFEKRLEVNRLEEEANNRGALKAKVQIDGSGRCPHCDEWFHVQDSTSNDEVRCAYCRTRLQPVLVKPKKLLGHTFVGDQGTCHKCGSTKAAVQHFGWPCRKSSRPK